MNDSVNSTATATEEGGPDTAAAAGPRHFLDLKDIDATTLRDILATATVCKEHRRDHARPLTGKSVALIFGKPSTRTRVSFEVAIRELGGDPVILFGQEMQLGRGETVADTARVLSRYVDGIMLRTDRARNLYELARYATVPVINGLTEASHPCQIMADIMTFEELRGPITDQVIAWCGDGNNVARSWIEASARFGFTLRLATPPELAPPKDVLDWAKAAGARVEVGRDPRAAVEGARCVITDTWVSMSDDPGESRHNLLAPFRVTKRLMAEASPDAIFMHCLPAHRGEEVEAGVIDGPQSVVFQEAENRLHVQKGILAWAFAADEQT